MPSLQLCPLVITKTFLIPPDTPEERSSLLSIALWMLLDLATSSTQTPKCTKSTQCDKFGGTLLDIFHLGMVNLCKVVLHIKPGAPAGPWCPGLWLGAAPPPPAESCSSMLV